MGSRMCEAILLAIDTCGSMGGVALGRVSGPGVPAETISRRDLAGKTYSSLLLPKIQEMLAECRISLGELKALVVVTGPGSFTGIRIGVSAAKGLGEALGIPIIAVSRLEVLEQLAGMTAVVLDAGRGEFYARIEDREFLLTRDEVLRAGPSSGKLGICEPQLADVLAEARPVLIPQPTASQALELGAERWGLGAFSDAETLDANYLRRTDAELSLERRMNETSDESI